MVLRNKDHRMTPRKRQTKSDRNGDFTMSRNRNGKTTTLSVLCT